MRIQPTMSGILIVIVSTCGHGVLTDRWSVPATATCALSVTERLPLTIGDWCGTTVDADPTLATTGCCYFARRYTNSRTGDVVTMTLVWGRAGPVSVHTPEVCYRGAGFELAAPATKHAIARDGATAADEFWCADFRCTSLSRPAEQRVLWAWSAAGLWIAANHPRVEFARRPLLFKLYVVRQTAATNEPADREPCIEFVRLLVPELD